MITSVSQHPLEQLNRYDAQANAEYYGRRPWLAISRIFKIIYFAISFGLAFGWDVLTGNTVSQPKLAEQLRKIITSSHLYQGRTSSINSP